MSKRRLLPVVRVLGVLSLLFLLLLKAPPHRVSAALMERLCPIHHDYGDEYSVSQVLPFKVPVGAAVGPDLAGGDRSKAGDYRVYTIGDSFFYFHRGHDNFVKSLSERLHEPVFHESWDLVNPSCLFDRDAEKFKDGKKRILLVSVAEKLMSRRFVKLGACPDWMAEQHYHLTPRRALTRAVETVFADRETPMRVFLSHFILTERVSEALNTARFHLFPASMTTEPRYSLDPPFLFSWAETDPDEETSFYRPHPDALVAAVADTVAGVARDVKTRYGAEMVFMPVPNKYTIEHRLVNQDKYDDYLPRLYAALDKRGVRTVRLYEPFMAAKPPVYYPTDVHWNPRGIEIALDEAVKALRAVPVR